MSVFFLKYYEAMFSTLLILSIPISLFGLTVNYEYEPFLYTLIVSTQFLCCLNLFVLNKRFQQILHDIFVYVLTYGLLSSNVYFTKNFSMIMAGAMLATRFYCKRCIFLYWNTDRNCDYDVIVFFMMIVCALRTQSLLYKKECVAVSLFSHLLCDKYENSFVKKLFEK